MKCHFLILLFLSLSFFLKAQYQKVELYFSGDTINKRVKTVFYVREDRPDIMEGDFMSFYESGQVKSNGQYKNGSHAGEWQYFFENGAKKMHGVVYSPDSVYWEYFYEKGGLKQKGLVVNHNKVGLWEFYYENQQVKKNGGYYKGLKDDNWKYYYEDGALKANANFEKGTGLYTEYSPSGDKTMEGKIHRNVSEGIWKYFYPDGTIQAQGPESNGVKNGIWSYYFPNGELSSKGNYVNGEQHGDWQYFHQNGVLSSNGNLSYGFKDGKWKSFSVDGAFKGEGEFKNGDGVYQEYYENGNLRVKGTVKKDKNHGVWKYYFKDGGLEGECDFIEGEGEYKGYYASGEIKMKGVIKDGNKTGVWVLYNEQGEIAGYYKTTNEESLSPIFDEENTIEANVVDSVKTEGGEVVMVEEKLSRRERKAISDSIEKAKNYDYTHLPKYNFKARKKSKIRNFNPKPNEYKNLIVSVNPLGIVSSSLPVYVEYYIQERIGWQFTYILERVPLFGDHNKLEPEELSKQGFNVGIGQKLYRFNRKEYGMLYGMWDIRYKNLEFRTKTDPQKRLDVDDTYISLTNHQTELTFLIGDRMLKSPKQHGPTFDIYMGLGIGYRVQKQSFEDNDYYNSLFSTVNKKQFYLPVRFGFSFGYLF